MNYKLVLFFLLMTLSCANSNNIFAAMGQGFGNLFATIATPLKFFQDSQEFRNQEISESLVQNHIHYDYIIVGAGTAGCTLAARLTEKSDIKVLLIEAGGNENFFMDIPLASLGLQFISELNYGYLTENTGEYCRGMTNGQCAWPAGRVTGGTSVINFMSAVRGSSKNYDDWARELNDDSWNYNSMLKYFKKLENFHINGVAVDHDYHNYNGPIHISHKDYKPVFADDFIKAGKEVFGLPEIDYNGAHLNGFSLPQVTMKNSERWSVNRAYLHPARNRKNLHITRHSLATKILIDYNTAKGVQYKKNNINYQVFADKEVIITAGTIGTPKLLMLSGIGPKKHLEEMNIDCVKDIPGVGKNLIDPFFYLGLIFQIKKGSGFITANILSPFNGHIANYADNRKGPLSNSLFDGFGFVNTKNITSQNETPDVALFISSGTLVEDAFSHNVIRISNEYWNKYFVKLVNQDAFQLGPLLLNPKSRGKIILKSNDPNDKPRIFANYLTHKDDIKTMIKGIRMAIQLGRADALKKHQTWLYDRPVPGCEDYKYDSDEYWECALRTFGTSGNSFVGTCKMGLKNDSKTVVDSDLKVVGINNLRIGDASVMPSLPSILVNIPTIAIAEKLSDLIKHNLQY